MCLWFKRKPDIESSFDPRVGNANITSPISGAYADPVSPPVAIITGGIPTPELTPLPPLQMSLIAEVTQQTHPQHSQQYSPPIQNSQRLSSSTQFSSHHSISGSPSPGLSSKWTKSPDTDHNYSRSPSQQRSPAHSPGRQPSGLDRTQSSQSGSGHSGNTSPALMPVHQAYRPPDQLSIGAKLSPGLTVHSNSTPPTTGGLMTGTSHFSYGIGNSTTTSPIDGRNPWGTKSATASPIDGRNPWNSHRESQNSASVLLNGSHAIKEEGKAVIKPPWERDIPVAVVPLAAAVQEKSDDSITMEATKKEERKEEKNRMTRIHIPTLPSFKLGSAPKRGQFAKQQRDMEMSPETASPSPIDQWPGRM